MAIGFVLITTVPGKESDVFSALRKISEIKELYPVFGDYDIIAKVEAKDPDALGAVIINKIRSISGIADTKTLTTGFEM
ncbi:MAG: Lrp/AsnC ligand binding domain-containing protein [Candidatus Thermoplasmatota archaeon]